MLTDSKFGKLSGYDKKLDADLSLALDFWAQYRKLGKSRQALLMLRAHRNVIRDTQARMFIVGLTLDQMIIDLHAQVDV